MSPEPDAPSFKEFLRASQVRAALGIEPLLKLLEHPSAVQRRAAVTSLGLSGDRRAIGSLRLRLADPDAGVVAAAAAALQNLQARDAGAELAVASRHADAVAAVTAIGAMAALGCPEAADAACERLDRETDPDAVRRILAEMHGVRSPRLVEAARPLMRHASAAVRLEAALRVAESDDPEALWVLASFIYDPAPLVRDAAECACAALAPLYRVTWSLGLPFAATFLIYVAWRDSGGHLYFQGL